MQQVIQLSEDETLEVFWLIFAQMGVKIDYIQDNGAVIYSVPSMSDYTSIEGIMMAGEPLMNMVNQFFEENGMHPEGRIRSEYWTSRMGETAGARMQVEMADVHN